MVSSINIDSLITTDPKLRSGRPIIAGTGTSVRRVAALYNQGYGAEEIGRRLDHLTLTQVYAALTYYHANREAMDGDLQAEQDAYTQLAQQHYQQRKV
ncbi:DUF433 domain-containing protein [Roseofilum sp. BLCC_M91]|uniref:DUF433 domain-containing protein n=1 Tax=Roseofilum halophilum BLCC-M91 TaxID=3022259 RepID=A0ABT7BPG6_9CYAN|nr:DUF433 domain-containing protein [Roseofilum halophilum]MDJ1181074.1 DUF433 domain-containing protein [Roseofilum halophilum BLCC-M91]